MKLNEVKQVDEVNLSHVVGDYGAAGLKQIGNRLMGNAEGQLSVKDKMAKEKFIADFIGRANTNLNSAIKSGLVDTKMKAGTPQAQPAQPAHFDWLTYINNYEDLRRAGINTEAKALMHWRLFGLKEGRTFLKL